MNKNMDKENVEYIISKIKYAEESKRKELSNLVATLWEYIFEDDIYNPKIETYKLKEHGEDAPDTMAVIREMLRLIHKTI